METLKYGSSGKRGHVGGVRSGKALVRRGLDVSLTRKAAWKSDWRCGGNFQKGRARPSSQGRRHRPHPGDGEVEGPTRGSSGEAECLASRGVGW